MSTDIEKNTLVETYRERFGEPLTADEAYGYWLFVASVVLAAVGLVGFLSTQEIGAMREVAFGVTALGLAGALTGLVVGQSFDSRAKLLVYLGAATCVAAVAWFTAVYPSQWEIGRAATTNVILLYTVGLGVIALSGVVAPVVIGQSRARAAAAEALVAARGETADRDERIADLRDRLDERGERIDNLEAELSEARESSDAAQAETETTREALAAERTRSDEAEVHLERVHESNATFQLYRDKAGKWRWRLVHRNGQIIASSGESYASDRNARRGMRSVKRNAVGADVLWERDEEEPEPVTDPVAEESKASFELYRDNANEDRWRLRHDNGQIIAAAARGFSSKSAARDGVESVRSYVGPADYLTFDPAAFEVYEDAAGEYRWRLVHRNGRILADSGEGYVSRSNARRAVETVKETTEAAEVGPDDGARFELYEDAGDEHRWRLVSANGELVADSAQGYSDRSGLDDAVERVREYVPDADTLSVGEAAIEIYEDEAGEYRWRLRHRNGTILATGGEGYGDRSAAVDGVNSVKRNAANAPEKAEESPQN